MNRFLKGAFIFTGGFILCGITTIKLAVKSNTFRTVVKDKISNEVTTFLYGEKQPSRVSYANYTDLYRHRKEQPRRVSYANYTDVYRHSKEQRKPIDIVIETRKEAEAVLSHINDIFKNHGSVSVADVCDLCGLTSSFNDVKIGWEDPDSIAKMYIVRTRQGYQLKLPKPVDFK